MENEKKKRQKKKKNKQGKKNESVSATASVGDLTSENNNHVNVTNQNLNSENSDVQFSDRDSINGAETSRSVEVDKSYWLNKEASLESNIKELQDQLERNVSQSQKERNLWHHKEAELEGRICQLETEKDSWIKKENSAAETIASLNKDNAILQVQVVELEASMKDIYDQNEQLKLHISDLQSKIQLVENSVATTLSSQMTTNVAENENMKSQLESAQALVEKLLSENEKLVEKVNILNGELDQKSVKHDDDSKLKNSKTDESSADPDPNSSEKLDTVNNIAPASERMPSFKDNNLSHIDSEGSDLNRISQVSMESGEIVQIPLDENEIPVSKPATDSVPLTDAPLIGAPFRLISFVARYVSGADLVQT